MAKTGPPFCVCVRAYSRTTSLSIVTFTVFVGCGGWVNGSVGRLGQLLGFKGGQGEAEDYRSTLFNGVTVTRTKAHKRTLKHSSLRSHKLKETRPQGSKPTHPPYTTNTHRHESCRRGR